MECLACRNVSTLAWKILEEGADAFLSIPDSAAEEAVDILGRGWSGDPPVSTQPSGAAGLAGLISATAEPGLAGPLGLGKESHVLIIGSEGPAWTKELP
jgi:diaminopropionate ammonia-lyase